MTDSLDALCERLEGRAHQDTRGMTHDGGSAGTAHWWTRQRYDDVIAAVTALRAERARADLAEARAVAAERVMALALAYWVGYLQDEADDRGICLDDRQHELARDLGAALRQEPGA